MPSETHSEESRESTATSEVNSEHICPQCFKVFSSGHALGGHQNAHRFERILMKRLANIVEAHRKNRFIDPATGQPLVAPVAGNGMTFAPAPAPAPAPKVQPEIIRAMGGRGTGFVKIMPKASYGAHQYHYHPYAWQVSEETMRRILTKDLIGDRLPMKDVGDGPVLETSSKRTITDEELDLELKL